MSGFMKGFAKKKPSLLSEYVIQLMYERAHETDYRTYRQGIIRDAQLKFPHMDPKKAIYAYNRLYVREIDNGYNLPKSPNIETNRAPHPFKEQA